MGALPSLCTRGREIAQMSAPCHQTYRFNRIPIKIPISFYVAFGTSTLKLARSCEGRRTARTSSQVSRVQDVARPPARPVALGLGADVWSPGAGPASEVSPRVCGCAAAELYTEVPRYFTGGKNSLFNKWCQVSHTKTQTSNRPRAIHRNWLEINRSLLGHSQAQPLGPNGEVVRGLPGRPVPGLQHCPLCTHAATRPPAVPQESADRPRGASSPGLWGDRPGSGVPDPDSACLPTRYLSCCCKVGVCTRTCVLHCVCVCACVHVEACAPCVCMSIAYVSVCICVSCAHVFACVHVFMYMCVRVHPRVRVRVCSCASMCPCACASVCMHACPCARVRSSSLAPSAGRGGPAWPCALPSRSPVPWALRAERSGTTSVRLPGAPRTLGWCPVRGRLLSAPRAVRGLPEHALTSLCPLADSVLGRRSDFYENIHLGSSPPFPLSDALCRFQTAGLASLGFAFLRHRSSLCWIPSLSERFYM